MKKIFSLLSFVLVMLAFCSCSDNSPEGVAKQYFSYIQSGKYEKVVDLIHFKKEPTSEEKEQIVAMVKDKGAKELEKKGGITSFEIGEVTLNDEGTAATVKANLTYGDGTTDDDKVKLMKTDDGKWMVDTGK